MPRRLPVVLALLLGLVSAAAGLTGSRPAAADSGGEFMYRAESTNEANIYARVIRLQHAGAVNGRLLGTFERHHDDGSPAQFVIRSSDDDGASWSTLATVSDPQTGPGHPVSRMWQPSLFEFPRRLGDHAAGTLLLVGNTVPADGSFTQFYSWRSQDHGRTWSPAGPVQRGGTFGKGIWEPFLMLDARGRLVMHFADERDSPAHSQMLVQVVSTDGGETWGPVTRVVASAVPADRPGMPTLTRIGDHGKYVLSFEVCGRAHCEVRVKYSPDGTRWGPVEDLGERPVTTDGRYLGHSPYITWVPTGDGRGQLVLAAQHVFSVVGDEATGEDYRAVLLRTDDGRGPWSWAPSPWRVSNTSPACNANYSPHLLPGPSGEVRLTAPTSVGDSGPCSEGTGTAQIGTLPYADRFADTGQAGWAVYGGCWSVEEDTYVESCGNDPTVGPKALTGSTGWSDYTVAADVMVTSPSGDAGIVARLSDPSVGADSHQGYLAFFDVGQDTLTIARQDHAYQPLASVPVPGGLRSDTWYRVSFTVRGGHLAATLAPADGGTPTSVTASDPYLSFPAGMVALRNHAGTASYRDVEITPERR